MECQTTGSRLCVQLTRDFNLLTARHLRRRVQADDVDELCIDLSRSRLVDTEAIILLYELMKAGKRVKLKHPPDVFFEAIRILDLDTAFDLADLVEHDA